MVSNFFLTKNPNLEKMGAGGGGGGGGGGEGGEYVNFLTNWHRIQLCDVFDGVFL